MDVFDLHEHLIGDYAAYTNSFIRIRDERIRQAVDHAIDGGLLWPDPLLQLNPSFEPGASIEDLVKQGVLHESCGQIFRIKEDKDDYGKPMRLHLHQEQAIRTSAENKAYVLTTGTGSGKSLAYIIPAVDHVLRRGSGRGIQAIVVYPMNALANSQEDELDKFLLHGFGGSDPAVTYARYTGQESTSDREKILRDPPDILLTNYMMLELILTRVEERPLVKHASDLRFLVFDELHTYRGRQGADVSMLIRRCREAFQSEQMRCVGTSATMASVGTSHDQARVVGDVTTKIFGESVSSDQVIGETLRRNTAEYDFNQPEIQAALQKLVANGENVPEDFDAFCKNQLASWIETSFGLNREEETGKLIRRTPRSLQGEKKGAAVQLAAQADCGVTEAREAIKRYLYAGSRIRNPETGFPVFAFRLHQFISRGDTAWASLELEDNRFITLKGQQFVPGDRSRVLMPLVFCRACGQEYYRVDRPTDLHGKVHAREGYGRSVSDDAESGYLYISEAEPWPDDPDEVMARIPDDWIEIKGSKQKIKAKQPVPEIMFLAPDGEISSDGIEAAFVPTPFRFCLNPACNVAYNARQRSDVTKLSTIGSDGRSTATTILALTTVLRLKLDPDLEERAKKLLSFTDNRQDASLQAGHFNDFVEVGLIRSALYRAMKRAGTEGLRYEELIDRVAREMDLPIDFYSNDPELRGPALEETKRALRQVLRYFVYRDLERDWRVTSPNLEQCGLLQVDYLAIDEVAGDQKHWEDKNAHASLVAATPEQRAGVIRTLLDHLRRSVAIKEQSLEKIGQEKIVDLSQQRLIDPWILYDVRDLVQGRVAWPRSRTQSGRPDDVYISSRSNFGQYLRKPGVLPSFDEKFTLEDTDQIICDLFACLKPWGLVEEVRDPVDGSSVPGYQLPASILIWRAGDGSAQPVDPLRTTQETTAEATANRYFVEFYQKFAELGAGLEAREHTAQVPALIREERETAFKTADLAILFCSPTMELGVDISQLNVVNMRNVPPTPANYAQRSGRAGRSGQPALVYTYCSGFSPHDQYYFKDPAQMVAGAVTEPKIDLINRDLIKAHVQAVWLAESGLKLGQTLTEVLAVNEDQLSLPLQERVLEKLNDSKLRLAALEKSRRLLSRLGAELEGAIWYREDWLEDVLQRVPQSFDAACNRWRSLYRAAVQQRKHQNSVIGDHSRPAIDRDRAKRLRAQAESQITLLTDPQNVFQGDFYSYRYFASEGFLPGYNFPRLPLSAFIPARRRRRGRDEFLSRARFLAISEFGPRAVIYHEGARYVVNKVNLSFDEETSELNKATMRICSSCGFGHLVIDGPGADVCDNCSEELRPTDEIRDMLRLQNVSAKRTHRITSDEEERQRIGYQVQTTFRFAQVGDQSDMRKSEVLNGEQSLATMRYGDAAQIWRINLGWRKRKNENEHGFLLDVDRGYWATNKDIEGADRDDPMTPQVNRVVPYVEDHRNVLTFELAGTHDIVIMASLQAALKQAIQQLYQLEPSELSADPLPGPDDRRLIFFYESAEGGAGVLRQVAENPQALSEIARTALFLCHFDPKTGDDLAARPESTIECEAGCYDCLLDYYNQMEHRLIDRKQIVDILLDLAAATTSVSSGSRSRADELDAMMRQCDSQLERTWLQYLFDNKLRLPTDAQLLVKECQTRPDFSYRSDNTHVYIDGPHHFDEPQKTKDKEITKRLQDAGHMVIRFCYKAFEDDMRGVNEIIDKYADIFGARSNES